MRYSFKLDALEVRIVKDLNVPWRIEPMYEVTLLMVNSKETLDWLIKNFHLNAHPSPK